MPKPLTVLELMDLLQEIPYETRLYYADPNCGGPLLPFSTEDLCHDLEEGLLIRIPFVEYMEDDE